MTEDQQKEQFSKAYVRAVAAVAGVNTYEPVIDDDSVDIGFCSRIALGSAQRPRLEAQLKCTSRIVEETESFRFDLKIKNYLDLCIEDIVPRVLIVTFVPNLPENWLSQSPDEMILRKCAYWVNLAGSPETENESRIRVRVPKSQIFNVNALNTLLRIGVRP